MLTRLFSLLGIKWYEGLMLALMLVLGIVVYFQYQHTVDTEAELQTTRVELKNANAGQVRQHKAQQIDEEVVSTITQELIRDRRQQRKIREEISREYLIFSTPDADAEPEVTTDPTPARDETTTEVHHDTKTTQEQTTITAGDDDRGFEYAASGMQRTFCEATSTYASPDPTCDSS